MPPRCTEADIGASVTEWLRCKGWDVYEEVRIDPQQGRRADIVAIQDPFGLGVAWVIELKLHMSLALLGQAYAWRGSANFVSAACLRPRRPGPTSRAARSFCYSRGVGLIELDFDGMVVEEIHPRLQLRGPSTDWFQVVSADHQTHARAGSPGGGMWTPFRAVAERLLSYVREHPGVALRDAVKDIPHHYTSRAVFRHRVQVMARRGKLPGIRIKHLAGRAYLHTED